MNIEKILKEFQQLFSGFGAYELHYPNRVIANENNFREQKKWLKKILHQLQKEVREETLQSITETDYELWDIHGDEPTTPQAWLHRVVHKTRKKNYPNQRKYEHN
jgi:hypothetical protein